MEGTAPAPAAAPAAPAAPTAPAPKSGADRAAEMAAKYRAEEEGSPSEPAAEAVEQPSSPQDGPGPAAADSGGAQDDARERAHRERQERINRVRARETADRQKREAQEARRAQERGATDEIERLRKRVAELEPLDKVFSSEETLLAEAERREMTPDKLIAWMRQRLSDPQAVAQRQVKTEADALREEMRKQREEFADYIRKQEEAQQSARAQYQAQQKAHQFVQAAHSSAETHPLTAQLLAKYGPQGVVAYANQFVAPLLPESYDVSELHDHMEQLLLETQFSGQAARHSEPPAKPPASTNGAGQPVTTLSNSIAGERSTVQEAIPLHKLPLDKRAELLKEKYSREH